MPLHVWNYFVCINCAQSPERPYCFTCVLIDTWKFFSQAKWCDVYRENKKKSIFFTKGHQLSSMHTAAFTVWLDNLHFTFAVPDRPIGVISETFGTSDLLIRWSMPSPFTLRGPGQTFYVQIFYEGTLRGEVQVDETSVFVNSSVGVVSGLVQNIVVSYVHTCTRCWNISIGTNIHKYFHCCDNWHPMFTH